MTGNCFENSLNITHLDRAKARGHDMLSHHCTTIVSRVVLTCAQEEHLVAPIGSCHLVHCNCGELVVHVGSDHQGALVHWVYRIVHGGVVSHEVDHLVWVILCGFHVGGESASRTLLEKKKKSI